MRRAILKGGIMPEENKKKTPQQRYAEKNVKQYKFICVKTTEQEIIAKMESVDNKSGYVKSLIKKDIAETKK